MPTPDFVSLIEIAIEAKLPADRERLVVALAEMTAGNAPVSFHTDIESGQLILNGVSELSLDDFVDEIIKKRGIPVNIGQPRVGYRETISREATVDHTHLKQSARQFARVKISVMPDASSSGIYIESGVVRNSIPDALVAAVEKGIAAVAMTGPLIGFPVVGLKVAIMEAEQRERDSTPIAFEIAARTATRGALTKAGPKLLEPIMVVEVETPAPMVAGIMTDLRSRRGQMQHQEARGECVVLKALVPLDRMFGYQSSLRSISGGQASWTMTFSHYAQVPPNNRGPDDFGPAIGMRG